MCPILFEIGAPPMWATIAIALVFGVIGLILGILDQREDGDRRSVNLLRALPMALAGVAVGAAVAFALQRWGPLQVRGWGTMLTVGFAAGLLWAIYDTRKDEQITVDLLVDLTLAILVGAIVGARLISAALNWPDFARDPLELLRVWEGGLSFHGGLLGGFLGAAIYIHRRPISMARVADMLTPSITLGYAITRVGCFLNGCCYGAPSDVPWAITLPHLSGHGEIVPRHPVQLYATAASLVIFGLLLLIRRHLNRQGHLFLVYLILYSLARFGLEHFRRGVSGEIFAPLAPLTVAQFASALVALLAAILMVWDLRRARRDNPAK